ncbi:hypothetical protein KW842_16190 [Duganella sp. sic0402]|uniref:hypothetical protein n=1 Tax=Duganella sp. sic0402 TaxID=2854786 RepID=UPI001C471C8B|nr:hypothetical protein [Duganella sp. sic0402]MBV7537309.1 hypothetical protein [Duganella sp. sic0402]
MIVALTGVDGDGDSAVADLAEDLAMLRVAAGKRVLLVSPNPGHYDPQLFDDLVIHATARSPDAVLARANVILALIRPAALQRDGCAELLARLKFVQSANPSAQMLVAIAHGRRPLTAHQAGSVLVFVAQLPRARLADTLVLEDGGQNTYHSRHSELELPAYKQDQRLCAPEVRHLYREIFPACPNERRFAALMPRACPI